MNDPDQRLVGLRGATTCHDNTAQAIETATAALIDALVERNSLLPEQIVSLTFSVTADLNACFPAAVARRREGWHSVALLDCQQMAVVGDLPRCVRLWRTCGCRWTEHQPTLIWRKPVYCVRTDSVTTDSSGAGPLRGLPGVGLRRIQPTNRLRCSAICS